MIHWQRIVLHHTATPDGDALLDTEAIRRYHTAPKPEGRGWSDIGYHWIVEKVGGGVYAVVMGRPMYRAGAHVAGMNTGSIGVALVGDWSHKAPPAAQITVAGELCVALCSSLGIRSDAITGHGEHSATACPGRVPVEWFRDYVKRNRR